MRIALIATANRAVTTILHRAFVGVLIYDINVVLYEEMLGDRVR